MDHQDLASFLEKAIQLTTSIDKFHQTNKIHGALTPDSIIYSSDSNLISISKPDEPISVNIDSGGVVENALPLSRLAYLAPEQSGRIKCRVDHRADLYSLGAVFYEMLTGRPPFSETDPVELVSCHISKPPVPPEQINHQIPGAFYHPLLLHFLPKHRMKDTRIVHTCFPI